MFLLLSTLNVKDWSHYCKLIYENTSQKSSFVVVLGLHKSFIMKYLRSALKKKKQGGKKSHTHSLTDTHNLCIWFTTALSREIEWELKSSSKEIQICFLHNYKFMLSWGCFHHYGQQLVISIQPLFYSTIHAAASLSPHVLQLLL